MFRVGVIQGTVLLSENHPPKAYVVEEKAALEFPVVEFAFTEAHPRSTYRGPWTLLILHVDVREPLLAYRPRRL